MQMNGHSAHVQLEHKLMSETPQDFWLWEQSFIIQTEAQQKGYTVKTTAKNDWKYI